jgi:hypothetical protein
MDSIAPIRIPALERPRRPPGGLAAFTDAIRLGTRPARDRRHPLGAPGAFRDASRLGPRPGRIHADLGGARATHKIRAYTHRTHNTHFCGTVALWASVLYIGHFSTRRKFYKKGFHPLFAIYTNDLILSITYVRSAPSAPSWGPFWGRNRPRGTGTCLETRARPDICSETRHTSPTPYTRRKMTQVKMAILPGAQRLFRTSGGVRPIEQSGDRGSSTIRDAGTDGNLATRHRPDAVPGCPMKGVYALPGCLVDVTGRCLACVVTGR